MKFTVEKKSPFIIKTPCLVLFSGEGRAAHPLWKQINHLLGGVPAEILHSGEFTGRPTQSLLLHNSSRKGPTRILVIGVGKSADISLGSLRQAAAAAAQLLKQKKISRAVCDLGGPTPGKATPEQCARAIAEGFLLGNYRYGRYLGSDQSDAPAVLEQITLTTTDSTFVPLIENGIHTAEAICSGVCLARDLVNAPGNLKSPEYLAMQAVAMAEQNGLKARLLHREEMQRLGFGALLGVAQGSARPPYLIILEYRGTAAQHPPIALVGKGVTFDTGGISLKPADKMDEMKMDMGGAAAVIGTMQSAARLRLPVNLVAVIPVVENMPSGTAIRPGDILTSLSGKTIEVLNTDAEGRLILADALTYVAEFKPTLVIDLATLTGACIIALGNQAAAILGNDEKLIAKLLKAGQRSGERLWQLPLWKEYAEQIKSDFADLKNTGGRPAGTITAAAFLQKFADGYRWAHLDIAGMAWEDRGKAGTPRGGTGFGVRLLIDFLRNEAGVA